MTARIGEFQGRPSFLQDNDSEESEQGAFLFVEKFHNSNYSSGIQLEICALKCALFKLISDSDRHKVLILYLHKEDSKFSKKFCKYISEEGLKKCLDEHFLILGWDIGDESNRETLMKSLSEFDQLLPCIENIIDEDPVAFFINFLGGDFQICSILRRLGEFDDLESCLNILVNNFCQNDPNEVPELSDEKILSYDEFQQRMFNGLGDRDYDCYEPDQLKYLKDKIAFAFFGPLNDESGYNEKQNEQVEKMYEKIINESKTCAEFVDQVVMSVVYNCLLPLESEDSGKSTNYSPVPVFLLRKCRGSDNPCRIVIDHTGRVYKSWQDYLDENKFCKCLMAYPKDGRYEGYENGRVKLEISKSPACSIGRRMLRAADISNTVAGLGSTGVLVAAAIPAITIGPVLLAGAALTGAAVGAYSVGRSIGTLIDRGNHNESLSPKEAECRAAYLAAAGGAAGALAGGTSILLTSLASSGATIGTAGRLAANSINIANIGINGLAVGNSAVEITMRWWIDNETPSTLTVLQLSASIFFFGHAVYNFKTAGTIIEETQTSVIEDFNASLRSNRHRKTFRKLKLQTYRESMGNMEQGRAEVISAIKNIGNNKDDVFAFLTRSNKKFNELGLKISTKNGKILLGGLPIDPSKVGTISRADIFNFYSDLSSRPVEQEQTSRSFFSDFDFNVFLNKENFLTVTAFLSDFIKCPSVEKRIILILEKTVIFLKRDRGEIWQIFNILRTKMITVDWTLRITNMILGYMKEIIQELGRKYNMKFSKSEALLYFMQKISDELLEALKNPTEKAGRFIDYSARWILNAWMEYERDEQRTESDAERVRNNRVECTKCSGYYFTK